MLDLVRGYWQVPVRHEDRPKTAFATALGLYQFRVMPFDLQGAPATFQRMMDSLLRGYAAAYLDDVIIHSESWGEHLQHIDAVLTRLHNANLTVKPRKCQFAMQNCMYLGHIVGNKHIQPEKGKIDPVGSFLTPTSKKQVRASFGPAGYYRKFIPGFSYTAAPLTDLTRKTGPNKIVWTSDCDRAFKSLKENLFNTTQARFYARIHIADGRIRSQNRRSSESARRYWDGPTSCVRQQEASTKGKNYAAVKKECLAIKVAVEVFKVYLLGCPFKIQTDHRALEWLASVRENTHLTR